MSCIKVEINKEKGASSEVHILRNETTAKVSKEHPLKMRAALRRIALTPTSQRQGIRLNASVYRICTVANFMAITPDDVAWVDEYNDFIYNVISNTKWNVF